MTTNYIYKTSCVDCLFTDAIVLHYVRDLVFL